MTVMTMTGREFKRDIARANRAAELGPVFITERGEPAHVLLSMGALLAAHGTEPQPRGLLVHGGAR